MIDWTYVDAVRAAALRDSRESTARDLDRMESERDYRDEYDRPLSTVIPAVRAMACPTCDEGIVTIEYPRRCRECVKGGL